MVKRLAHINLRKLLQEDYSSWKFNAENCFGGLDYQPLFGHYSVTVRERSPRSFSEVSSRGGTQTSLERAAAIELTVLVVQLLFPAPAEASNSMCTVLTGPQGGGMSDDIEDISLFALSMTSSSS